LVDTTTDGKPALVKRDPHSPKQYVYEFDLIPFTVYR